MPVDIEGDHMVLLVWRGRLNLFWLSFVNGAQPQSVSSSDTSQLGGLPFDNLMSNISGSSATKQIQIQLHWSEYVQGKWSKAIASDLKKFVPLNVLDDFAPNKDVYIHVDKEVDANGNEGAARILVDMNGYNSFYGFRVTSKNCSPDFGYQYAEFAPETVYDAPGVDATQFTGSATLTSSFESQISGGTGTPETEFILNSVNSFDVLTCANPVVPPFLPANDPDYHEAGSLVGPFFFKDGSNPNFASQGAFQDERTFFVQPSLTETVLQEWDGWAIAPSPPPRILINPNLINQISVVAQVPVAGPVPVIPAIRSIRSTRCKI